MGGLGFLFVIGIYVFIAYEAVAKSRWVKVIALTAAQNDIAVRYALHELNPFAFYGADYSTHNANGVLDFVDYANYSSGRFADAPSAANDSEWRAAA